MKLTNPTVELSDDDLRLLVEACRTMASRYARDADYERSPVIKQVLVDAAAELSALGARLQEPSDRTARFETGSKPPPQSVWQLRAQLVGA